MNQVQISGKPYPAIASGNVVVGRGVLVGFLCTSSTSGTVAAYDDAATGTNTKMIDTMSMTAGIFYPCYMEFFNGLNLVFGGTLKVTAVLAMRV